MYWKRRIKFIERTLKLRVNHSKSGLFRPSKSKFLGYTFVGTSGSPRVAKASFARLRRGHGRSLLGTIKVLTLILRGWRTYYAPDDRKEIFKRIDIHIRRHLRELIWRAWKRPKTRERKLRRRGQPSEQAWKLSVNGRGPWWNANAVHMLKAFPNSVFRRMGLYSLLSKACPLNPQSDFRKRRMPNGTSGSVGGSEVQTRPLPDNNLLRKAA